MSINILNDLNRLFNKIIKTKKNNININIEFLLEFSNSIKLHSEELSKILHFHMIVINMIIILYYIGIIKLIILNFRQNI